MTDQYFKIGHLTEIYGLYSFPSQIKPVFKRGRKKKKTANTERSIRIRHDWFPKGKFFRGSKMWYAGLSPASANPPSSVTNTEGEA